MTYPRLTKAGNIVMLCKKCGNVFTLEKENLEFYRTRGLTPPKTCPTCLLFKTAKKNARRNGHRPVFTDEGLLNITDDLPEDVR